VGVLIGITLGRVSLDLAVVQFDGEGTAVGRYADAKDQFAAAEERRDGAAPWMEKVGFVERHHNGRLLVRGLFAGHYLDVDESDHVSQTGAGEGAAGGALVGVLLGPPGIALGFVIGGIVGAETGTPTEHEPEPEALAEQLRAAVPPSSSAVVLIADSADVDEMVAALGEGARGVVRRTLSAEQTAALEASLPSPS
jgi:uncharacterized membrane protein